jgi:hypothetical protein
MAMNAVVTSHLPVCLYSAAGGKVNRKSPAPAEQSPAPACWQKKLQKIKDKRPQGI